jgi:hypothetical protein
MEQDEFWRLIETMGTEQDDDDFERLTDLLAARAGTDIVAFEDQLASLLYALDTRAHARAARARGDWFLYVRCAALSCGRSVYENVLADPEKLRRFARREAEPLLYVASTAYERSTGTRWNHESPVSYESGSNIAGWGGQEEAHPLPMWMRIIFWAVRPFYRGQPAPDEDSA